MTDENKKRSFPGLGLLSDVKDLADKIPSEDTINRLLDALPRIEAILADPKVEKIAKLAEYIDTIDPEFVSKLESLIPVLRNLPSNTILVDIANMRPYLQRIPTSEEIRDLTSRLPSQENMKSIVGALEDLKGFLEVLRAGG